MSKPAKKSARERLPYTAPATARRHPNRAKCKPAVYSAMYPALVHEARRLGYALAVHGSMSRDFDLVAIPWTRFARPAEDLIAALQAVVGGMETHEGITEKCHGRMAVALYFGPGAYMDLSVMPRTAPFYNGPRAAKRGGR